MSRKKFKAILTDFDNTLVGHDLVIKPDLKKKILDLTKQGIIFSIATGRPFSQVIRNTCEFLCLKNLQIVNGGASIINPLTNELIWHEYMSKEQAKQIIGFFQQKHKYIAVELADTNYTSDGKPLDFFTQNIPTKKLAELPDIDIPKILLPATKNKLSEQQVNDIFKQLGSQYNNLSLMKFKYFDEGYGMDITSEKATKHTAVLEYMKLMNLKPEEVVGIGDGYNDYPLLTACGYKIAMGDAPQELKDIADYVTLPQKEDGLLMALNYLFS